MSGGEARRVATCSRLASDLLSLSRQKKRPLEDKSHNQKKVVCTVSGLRNSYNSHKETFGSSDVARAMCSLGVCVCCVPIAIPAIFLFVVLLFVVLTANFLIVEN